MSTRDAIDKFAQALTEALCNRAASVRCRFGGTEMSRLESEATANALEEAMWAVANARADFMKATEPEVSAAPTCNRCKRTP